MQMQMEKEMELSPQPMVMRMCITMKMPSRISAVPPSIDLLLSLPLLIVCYKWPSDRRGRYKALEREDDSEHVFLLKNPRAEKRSHEPTILLRLNELRMICNVAVMTMMTNGRELIRNGKSR